MSAVESFKAALAQTVVELKLFVDEQYQKHGVVVFDPESVAVYGKVDAQMTLLAFAELTKQGMFTVRSDLYCDNGHVIWSGTPDQTHKYLRMACPHIGEDGQPCDHNDGLAEENSENVAHERLWYYVLKDPPKRYEELLEPLWPKIKLDIATYGSAWVQFTPGKVERLDPTSVTVEEE